MLTLLETLQTAIGILQSLLPYIGLATLTGIVGLYVAWITLPPKLTIEAVVDKHKKYNSESRITLKNIGKLPAWNIRGDIENAAFKVGGVNVNDVSMSLSPNNSHLNGGETTEIPVLSQLLYTPPTNISRCEIVLNLKIRYAGNVFQERV